MSIPLWVLLGFAAWTLLTLFATVGVYRWTRILSGRTGIAEWRADEPQGSDWYRRAQRAHMNCLENLPVYTALVIVLYVRQIDTTALDALALSGGADSADRDSPCIRADEHGGRLAVRLLLHPSAVHGGDGGDRHLHAERLTRAFFSLSPGGERVGVRGRMTIANPPSPARFSRDLSPPGRGESQSIFRRSMPSDLIRGWIPVRRQKEIERSPIPSKRESLEPAGSVPAHALNFIP